MESNISSEWANEMESPDYRRAPDQLQVLPQLFCLVCTGIHPSMRGVATRVVVALLLGVNLK